MTGGEFKMKKITKKMLGFALAFGGTSVIFGSTVSAARGTIYNETVGNDVTVEASANAYPTFVGHAFGVYIQQDQHTIVGDRLTVNVSGQGADGLRSNPSGLTNWQQAKGSITIGDDLKVTTSGVSGDAINANGATIIKIGDGAILKTTYAGDLKYADNSTADGAHAVRANFHAEITIGNDMVASTLGGKSHALYSAQGLGSPAATEGAKIRIGNDGSGATEGNGSHAAYIASKNGLIQMGDRASLSTVGDGSYAAYISSVSGQLVLEDEASLKTEGQASHGIYATGADSVIQLGDQAQILTQGEYAHSVFVTSKNGTATLGTEASLRTEGDGAYGIYLSGYRNAAGTLMYGNGKIDLGAHSQIITSGNNAYGVLMYGQDGKVILGEETTVTTNGDGSHALYGHGMQATPTSSVYGDNGTIIVEDGVNLQTSGVGAHGAFVDWGTSKIEFQGGGTISVSGDDSYVLYADAGKITSKLDTNGDVVSGGKFIITGDMLAANGGAIDLILADGSIFVGSADQGTGSIKLKMESGSKWYVTKDETDQVIMEEGSARYLGTLADHSGLGRSSFVPLRITEAGTLTVNGGTTYFRTDIENRTSDQLVVTNAVEGTGGKVGVYNNGGSNTDGTEKVVLIEAKQGGAGFTLLNEVELGGYVYTLGNEADGATGTNWFLYSTEKSSKPASASMNVFSGGYLLNYAETQTLLQRMGDLRQGDDQWGAWARVFGGKFGSSGDYFLSGFDMNYRGMQAGVDRKLSFKGKGDLYVGGMFGYSKGELDYGAGSGSIDSKTIGAYGTYIAPSGLYADLVLKYGWMKNDFKVLDTAGALVTGENMSTDGLSASLEIGQKIHFNKAAKDGWYVEPQAQISMGHQSGGYFNASNGLRVDVDSYNSTLGRLGMNVGYEAKSGKNPINVYAKASYVHEFDGDVGYRLNGSAERTSFGDSWWTYGVGITAQLNKKHNVYLDIERASGGKFNQPWSVNGGYRFSW